MIKVWGYLAYGFGISLVTAGFVLHDIIMALIGGFILGFGADIIGREYEVRE